MKRSMLLSGLLIFVLALSACTPNNINDTVAPAEEESEIMYDGDGQDGMNEDAVDGSQEQSSGANVFEDSVSYTNPGGADEVGFRLEVDENGVVTDVEATVMAENSTSIARQNAFKNGLKSAVVGKPLAGLTVDRVGGSSLTSKAFNDWVSAL